jgi:hypothetical protein
MEETGQDSTKLIPAGKYAAVLAKVEALATPFGAPAEPLPDAVPA